MLTRRETISEWKNINLVQCFEEEEKVNSDPDITFIWHSLEAHFVGKNCVGVCQKGSGNI